MSNILILLLIVLMGMVIYSLVRGIMAFLNSTKEDLNRPASEGPSANQLLQNKMMFARIKYQALAVVVVAIIFAVSK